MNPSDRGVPILLREGYVAQVDQPWPDGGHVGQGETTGHAHVITKTNDAVLLEDNGAMYLRVLRETVVEHEEHKQITVPAGDYSVSIVQEYDHFSEEAKSVRD